MRREGSIFVLGEFKMSSFYAARFQVHIYAFDIAPLTTVLKRLHARIEFYSDISLYKGHVLDVCTIVMTHCICVRLSSRLFTTRREFGREINEVFIWSIHMHVYIFAYHL